MADYYPLIARAIAGLDPNTGEARRALYERARTALVAQLRGIQPPLQEAEITRERLALEEAVRKVEAEAARRSAPAGAPQTPPPAVPPLPPAAPRLSKAAPPRPAAPPPPGAPRLPAGTPPPAPPRPPVPQSTALEQLEPRVAQEDFHREPRGPRGRGDAPAMDPFRENRGRDTLGHDIQGQDDYGRDAPGPDDFDEDEHDEAPRRGRRSLGPLIKIAVAVLLVAGLAVAAWSQRAQIANLFKSSPTQVARDNKSGAPASQDPQSRPKITDRLGSDQQQAGGPAVAQRVVLYEEEPNDPQGRRYIGSAIWRTETVSPGPGRPPELAIRADVEIPERRMTMTFSLRRNTDQTLPASHTIEVMFNLPADFPHGGIQNVPGVLMKQAEQTRGTPLAGLAVKVTNNFFLIGLSAVEADMQRNIQLLKERAWFDIPIVYNNNRRAILAIEKGNPGERVFAEAFAAWKQ